MTIHPTTRSIFRLAVPSIVSNITVPLLGLIDVAIAGHLGSERFIAAIAVGSMLFNVTYWLLGFLRMGTGGLTAQMLGRRDLSGVVSVLMRSLLVAMLLGLALVVLQWPVVAGGLWLIGPEAAVRPLAQGYAHIVIWGAPAMLGIYGLTGWQVGMQNTRLPMVVSITQNVVNILVSLLLVVGLRWGLKGVAVGTLVAQWTGFVLSAALTWRGYGRLYKYVAWGDILRRDALLAFFRVNRDIFLRTLALVSVTLAFTSFGARQGATVLAVNTLLMQFFLFFSYFTDGFAYAAEALCGRYHGASNRRGLADVVARVFRIGYAMALVFTTVYLFFGPAILRLLTSETAVVAHALGYLPWVVAIPLLSVGAFLWDGVYIGITFTRGMLIVSATATALFFALFAGGVALLHVDVVATCLPLAANANHVLWLAYCAYCLMRGVMGRRLFGDGV